MAIRYFSLSSPSPSTWLNRIGLAQEAGRRRKRNERNLVESFVKLGQLRRFRHDRLVHEEGRLNFFESTLLEEVKTVVDHG